MTAKLSKSVLKPAQWVEFLKRLEGPEGCNFRQTKRKKTTWTCDSTNARPLATKILVEMKVKKPERVLEFCTENGGYCDCEILFNVAEHVE